MYNNVGLRTPRGSGTSGHIMSNRSHVRPQAFRTGVQRNTGKLQDQNWQQEPPTKKANGELLDHQRKRKVEAKIFELQEAMAERGYNEEEIAAKVAEVRKGLEERVNNGRKASLPSDSASGAMDSHMRGVKKEEDNRKMREAFGLGDDYAAGESFDQEAQERKRDARKREREAKAAEREAKLAAKAAEEKRLRKETRRREKAGETATPIAEQAGPEKPRAEAEAGTNPEMPPPDGVRRGRGQFRAGGEKMEQSEGVRGRYGGRGPDQAGRVGNADSERGRGDRDGGDLRGDRGDSRDGRISNAKDVLDRGLTTIRGRGRRYDGFPGGGYDDMDRRSRGLGKGRVGDERDRYLEGNAKHGVEDHYAPEVGVREAERWRPQDREDESVGYEVNEIADRRENGQGKRRVEGADDRDEFDDRDGSPSHKKSRPVPREVTVVEADRYYAQRRAENAAEQMRESRRGGGAPSNGRDTAYDGDRDSDSDQQHGVEVEQKQERKGREVLIREVRHVPIEDRDTERAPRKKGKEGGKAPGERWLPAEDGDGGGSKAKSRDGGGGGGHRGEKEASRAKGRKEAGDSPMRQQQQQRRRREEEDSPESDASAGDGERESLREAPPRGKDDVGPREKHRDRSVDKPRPRSRKDEEHDEMNHRRARDTDPAKSSSAGKGRQGREDLARSTKRRRGRSEESSSSSGSSSSSSSSSSTGTGSASSRSSSGSSSKARRPAALRSPSGSSLSPSPPPARSGHSRRR